MIRTSELFEFMSYHRLIDDGIIFEPFKGQEIPTKKFPPIVKQNHAHFGLFIDHLFINQYLNTHEMGSHRNAIPVPGFYQKPWKDVYVDLHKYTCGLFGIPENDDAVVKTKNYFIGMETFVKSIARDGYVFETEETFDQIQLHPDVVVGDTIYDIKTTGNLFGKQMYPHVTFQLLAYCAFRRMLGYEVNTIGVILPMQRMIVEHDVSGWDSSRYLIQLLQAFGQATARPMLSDLVSIHKSRGCRLGMHMAKVGGILPTIQGIAAKYSDIPVQIFLRANRQFRGNVGGSFTRADRKEVRRILRESNIRLYIHAPYVINLCRESNEIDTIKDDLIRARWLSAKGVVFHVGKKASGTKDTPPMTETVEECLDCMERKIRELLPSASERTPLCMETPAKQGKKKSKEWGEVLSNVEAMIEFYNRFSDEDKKRFKICVDTCHVFSAGYWPMDYIHELESRCPGSIRLIHYNDSSVPLGACNDSHYPVGGGYLAILNSIRTGVVYRGEDEHIGVVEMAKVARWCMENKVDGVRE